jgi:hypothetical protein
MKQIKTITLLATELETLFFQKQKKLTLEFKKLLQRKLKRSMIVFKVCGFLAEKQLLSLLSRLQKPL